MTKSQNRTQMPTVANVIDETRKYFKNAKVAYASENGRVVGEKIKTCTLVLPHVPNIEKVTSK